MAENHFDYQSVSEEPELLDFEKKVPCPHCKKPIPLDATMCLYCGVDVSPHGKPRWTVWTVVVVIVLFLALMVLRK